MFFCLLVIGLFGLSYNVSAANGGGGGIFLNIFVDGGLIDDINYTYRARNDLYYRAFASSEIIKLPSITKDGFIIEGLYYDVDYTDPVVFHELGDGYIYIESNLDIYVKWKDIRAENTINIIFNSWFDLIKNLAVGLNTVFTTLFISDGGLSMIGIWFLVIFGIGLAFFLINCVFKIIRKKE